MRIDTDLLFRTGAGRILGIGAAGVRYYEETGRLNFVTVGARRVRLFLRSDVEALRDELLARKKKSRKTA